MSEYWMAACPKCGWVGSSKDCEGGGQIADTGDYAEVVCPRCFKGGHGEWVEVEDAEEYLAASKAREAALRKKLSTLEANAQIEIDRLNAQILDRDKKLEERTEEMLRIAGLNAANVGLLKAAEARIKASQEQEPVAYLNIAVWKHAGYDSIFATPERAFDNQDALYAQPPIQPELAELQRDLSGAIKAQNELHEQYYQLQRENAELRKLLEESKVPEGWQLVPKNETEAMHDAVMAVLYKGVTRMNTQKLLDAYLAAAQQPKESKQ